MIHRFLLNQSFRNKAGQGLPTGYLYGIASPGTRPTYTPTRRTRLGIVVLVGVPSIGVEFR